MIPPQVGMRLWTENKKRGQKKGEGPNKKTKNERQERRGNATILLPQLCFKVAP